MAKFISLKKRLREVEIKLRQALPPPTRIEDLPDAELTARLEQNIRFQRFLQEAMKLHEDEREEVNHWLLSFSVQDVRARYDGRGPDPVASCLAMAGFYTESLREEIERRKGG